MATTDEILRALAADYDIYENNDFKLLPTADAPQSTDDDEYLYYGSRELAAFHDMYQHCHGYLASAVCIFGIIANVLNIIVLTRRNMISATNCILTGLAVSDGLTMVAYLPFALRFYVFYGTEPTPTRNSLPAVRFMLFYACFSVVVHTVSIWLTVVLAVFRYLFIRFPRQGADWCSIDRAKLAIFLVHVVTLIVCIPNFVTMTLHSQNATTGEHINETELEHVDPSELVWNVGFKGETTAEKFIQTFNFWIQALLVKLVPCLGLTVLSLLLVQTMKEAEARRQNLRAKSHSTLRVSTTSRSSNLFPSVVVPQPERVGTTTTTGDVTSDVAVTRWLHDVIRRAKSQAAAAVKKDDSGARERKTNRTTRMLLVVVVLFLMTEFPQGVINLLSGVLDHFVEEVYMMLGDLLDILALINNGINFILYCAMSKQFRDTFVRIFRLSVLCKGIDDDSAIGAAVGPKNGTHAVGGDGSSAARRLLQVPQPAAPSDGGLSSVEASRLTNDV